MTIRISSEMKLSKTDKDSMLYMSHSKLEQFKEILARGLNTAPPEKYPDWVTLADQLLAEDLEAERSSIRIT